MQCGRWSRERYCNAQASLAKVLQDLGATAPAKAILRPALREAARKVIGDTGLLDHLLKHSVNKALTEEQHFLRRQHDSEGHMEYWVQRPGAPFHSSDPSIATLAQAAEIESIKRQLQQVMSRSPAAGAASAQVPAQGGSLLEPDGSRASPTAQQQQQQQQQPSAAVQKLVQLECRRMLEAARKDLMQDVASRLDALEAPGSLPPPPPDRKPDGGEAPGGTGRPGEEPETRPAPQPPLQQAGGAAQRCDAGGAADTGEGPEGAEKAHVKKMVQDCLQAVQEMMESMAKSNTQLQCQVVKLEEQLQAQAAALLSVTNHSKKALSCESGPDASRLEPSPA